MPEMAEIAKQKNICEISESAFDMTFCANTDVEFLEPTRAALSGQCLYQSQLTEQLQGYAFPRTGQIQLPSTVAQSALSCTTRASV